VALTVRFPLDTVFFGDVHAGETTPYQDVPNGVFRYGAFRYTRDGRRASQPVTDFVGETPQDGNFTYQMRFAPIDLGGNAIRSLLTIEKVIRED
jgi:hypothetical protein